MSIMPVWAAVFRVVFPVIIAGLCCTCSQKPTLAEQSLPQHIKWLKSRMVPNTVLPSPLPSRQNLVLSYDIPESDPAYPYLYSKSFLYDNALAVIALTSAGEYEAAGKILMTLSSLMNPDGSFYFNYSLSDEWPYAKDESYALVRTGAVAWAGYAYCFFLENHPKLKPADPLYERCLETAVKISGYLKSMEVTNPADPLNGLVLGGRHTTFLRLDTTGQVEEIWQDTVIDWTSTEHNIDVHLFLTHLAALTHDTSCTGLAARISENMMAKLWSSEKRQFIRGLKKGGVKDTVLALDCATWAVPFLFNTGRDSLARTCLTALQPRYATTWKSLQGCLPYAECAVYDSVPINRHYFPDDTNARWGDFPLLWFEGSYGALMALKRAGYADTAASQLDAYAAFFEGDSVGGIPYSLGSRPVPFQFTFWKSVASTAWHIILVSQSHDSKLPRPFFSAGG